MWYRWPHVICPLSLSLSLHLLSLFLEVHHALHTRTFQLVVPSMLLVSPLECSSLRSPLLWLLTHRLLSQRVFLQSKSNHILFDFSLVNLIQLKFQPLEYRFFFFLPCSWRYHELAPSTLSKHSIKNEWLNYFNYQNAALYTSQWAF